MAAVGLRLQQREQQNLYRCFEMECGIRANSKRERERGRVCQECYEDFWQGLLFIQHPVAHYKLSELEVVA